MPDNQTYDYTQDPDFLSAHTDQQHAYLMANEPDYAKAPPEKQNAYLSHLRENAPLPVAPMNTQMNKVEPLTGNQVTPEKEQSIENRAASVRNHLITPITDSASVIMPVAGALGEGGQGLKRGLNTLARGTVGAATGAAAGRYGGRSIGGMVGAPEAGETIGSLVGGLAGGYAGVKSMPEPFDPNLPTQAHAEMEQDIAEGQRQRAGAKSEMEKDFASRASKTPEAVAKRGLAVGKAKSNLVHGRPFEDLNEQEQAEALMRRGKEQGAIDAGVPVEGSSQKVAVLPEPHEPLPGDKPGSQWSVKRRTDLVQNAKRGQPGATEVIKNQRPVVLEPREGTGYGGPRQWDPNATVSESGPITPTQSGPNKVGETNIPTSPEESARVDLEKQTGVNVHDLADKYLEKNPNITRAQAYDRAEESLKTISGKFYTPMQKKVAQEFIDRMMGPEQRGPVRLGPEARGIK